MGSPVPASSTSVPLALLMLSAPMLNDGIAAVPAFALKTGSVSVSGMKMTLAAAPAALVDFQTPPPAVPR